MLTRFFNRIKYISTETIYTEKLLETIFSNKSVALVGSSPEIFSNEFGSQIDSHDIVVHFNLLAIKNKEKYYGSRTDVRLIGATLVERHIPFLENVKHCPVLITSIKNKNFLIKSDIKAFYYGAFTPENSFKYFDSATRTDQFSKCHTLPPRSGLFFLSIILKFGNPSKISLFGMSKKIEQTLEYVSYSNFETIKYDESLLTKNHCNPNIEVEIINTLESKKIISVY